MIGTKVKATVWHYVPSFDGEDVDKDFLGEVIGTIQEIAPYNPNIVRIKVEQY